MTNAGRPKALDDSKLLKAIGYYQTTSPSILAKKLKVSRKTIQRRLKDIPNDVVEATLAQIQAKELKPHQKTYENFLNIPIIAEYRDKLLFKRKVSENYASQMLRGWYRICKRLNKHPNFLATKETVKEVVDLLIPLGKGEFKMGLIVFKKSVRTWYENQGIAGQYLTSEGASGEASKGTGKRAHVRFTEDERCRFLEVLKEQAPKSQCLNGVAPDYALKAIEFLPIFAFISGTRKKACFETNWSNVSWDNPITTIRVLDKGLHRKGRKEWFKRIAGKPLERFKDLWNVAGKPSEGRIFPFNMDKVVDLFKQCYEIAGIPKDKWNGMPFHIWRHTACQEYLEATDYNWDLVAKTLGWDSVDTMKKSYGKVPEKVIRRGLLKSMGLKVPDQEKREFRFCMHV